MVANPTVPTDTKEFQAAKSASQKVIRAYLDKHPELSKQEAENITDKFSFDFECYDIKRLSKYRTPQAESDYRQMLEGMREYAIARISILSDYMVREEDGEHFYHELGKALEDYDCDKHLRHYEGEDYYYELCDAIEDLEYVHKKGGIEFKSVTLDDVA